MKTDTKQPLAMILGDGGIKAGFIAGAADELIRHCRGVDEHLEQMVGVSASVGNIIYYLALGNKHPGKEMWTTLLTDPRFMHFSGLRDLYKNQPLYDLDFMVEKIFKEENPIDQSKAKNHRIKFYLPAQRDKDKKILYFTNDAAAVERDSGSRNREMRNVDNIDLYDIIKAASAAPLIFDGTFEIEGERYLDAAAVEPLPIDLPEIANAKKIIILTKGRAGILKKIRYILMGIIFMVLVWPFKRRRLSLSKYWQYGTKPFRLNRAIDFAVKEERAGRAILIHPTKKIGGLLDNSNQTLQNTYDHGVECARSKFNEIEKMLKDHT